MRKLLYQFILILLVVALVTGCNEPPGDATNVTVHDKQLIIEDTNVITDDSNVVGTIARLDTAFEALDSNSVDTVAAMTYGKNRLNEADLETVKRLFEIFKDVDKLSYQEWLNSFLNGDNHKLELDIYTHIADVFQEYQAKNNLNLDQKKELYNLLVLRSMQPTDQILKRFFFKHLTSSQGAQAMQLYKLPPIPSQ